jgi:macrolide transport system ATP-binding/permease protein
VASSTHLRADGISHGYGDRRVLTDVCLVADARERIGIIGENGAGKSTLLRVLAGVEAPDAGTVVRPASIGLLQQELPFRPSQTLDDVLEHALRAVRHAERQLGLAAEALAETALEERALAKPALAERDDADPAEVRYAAALAHAEAIDVWGADSRRDTALAGLGLAGIDRSRRISEVSGGQRSRLALAALLLAQPGALLLDEPTNHLDDSATDYLRAQLVEWPGVVVFASHDRAFLDEVATSVIDLDPRADDTARRFGGTFSDYLETKSAERMRWDDRYVAEQQEIARLHDQVAVTSRQIAHDRPKRDNEKMGYDATAERVQGQISRRVRSARSRLDQLEVAQVARPPAPLTFAGIPHGTNPLPADSGVLVELDEVGAVGRLEPVSLSIEPRSRILVTGPNGAGKSTLLAVLAGMPCRDAAAVSDGGKPCEWVCSPRTSTSTTPPAPRGRSTNGRWGSARPSGSRSRRSGCSPPVTSIGRPVSSRSGSSADWHSRSSWHAPRSSSCSTNRRTTSRSPSPASSRRPSASTPAP